MENTCFSWLNGGSRGDQDQLRHFQGSGRNENGEPVDQTPSCASRWRQEGVKPSGEPSKKGSHAHEARPGKEGNKLYFAL